jgi:type IV pilus assembly protein PilW
MPARGMQSSRMPRHSGCGLVEALAALALGLFVIAAAVSLHAHASRAARVIDAHARMHETARIALAVIESDVRMAGFWGLAHAPENVTVHPSFAFPARCGGAPWVTDIARLIDGTNNEYLGVSNCAASGGGAQPGSDVLIVRRASARPIALGTTSVPAAARDDVLLVSTREQAVLFVPNASGNVIPPGYPVTAPPGSAPPSELHSVRVNAYYVSVDSSAGDSVPALRRKILIGGPTVSDEEIAPGVEDLQFRIGADVDDDGVLDGLFEPGEMPTDARPLCVRVWLRVREIERSGTTAAAAGQSYADRTWPAAADGYHRMLVSRTIQIRNSRR